MQYALIGYMISFLVLFSNFYIHAYFVKKFKPHEKSEENGEVMANNNEVIANGDVVANGILSSDLKDMKKHD